MSISLSFDIGHSSIGWAAMESSKEDPDILGCGVVVFPSEDCQNQQRGGFRRQRRHIAATRNRIKRLEKFLVTSNALTKEEIEDARTKPHPWPWLLAAKAISINKILTWPEMWSVIRWYAHNRGYDGNALWAGESSDPEDVKKVQSARNLMEQYQAATMCETVCALLGVDPSEEKNPSLEYYFKGENAAFPRSIVIAEVRSILEAHLNKLKNLSPEIIECLLRDWSLSKELSFNAKLPERYHGGLLFGQLKPRFENRIIPKCRITGEKTPSKHCREFYLFRWAMLLNNIRVDDPLTGSSRPLTSIERGQLDEVMSDSGFLTKNTLKKALKNCLNLEGANLEAMFMVPEMEQALTLDPAGREVSGKRLNPIWAEVPQSWKSLFLNQLFHDRNFRGQPASLFQWRERMSQKGELSDQFDTAVQKVFDSETKDLEKKGLTLSFEEFSNRPLRISARHKSTGRAPYSRKILTAAIECVMSGNDPRAIGGPLEETESVIQAQRSLEVDKSSNNHLVRHRLKIFKKALQDLVKHYANNDPGRIDTVCVEVVRDLVQFSGKTAKEKAQLLGQQLAHHRKISRLLEDEKDKTGGDWDITAGLIKKVRIADDLDWTCPYTGKKYSLSQIIHGDVDREHIIPRSKRATDALHALVLTFSEINKEKGARTALQYIEDTKDCSHTFSPKQYHDFVKKLKSKNGPSKDDESRCTKRKISLLTRDYESRGNRNKNGEEEQVSGFTEGSLTQTSYLNKLAAQQTRHWFSERLNEKGNIPKIVQLSGSVTAATRKNWNLFDQLNEVCPETRGKAKSDIRELTHLHHALDAVSIGLSSHYFPRDGRIWALLSKRKIHNGADQHYLRMTLGSRISFTNDGVWKLTSLPEIVRSQICHCLREKRIVRHNPKTMRGLRVQQNTWRVTCEDPEDDRKMFIRMRQRDDGGNRTLKSKSERKSKLLGVNPSSDLAKLAKLKGTLIVEDNYGVALDPEPKVIPYQQVWKQLLALKSQNGNQPVRILRNGDIISVQTGRYEGKWRVHSIKDANMGLVLDLATPEVVKAKNKSMGSKMNVLLKTLIANGLNVANRDYSGSNR